MRTRRPAWSALVGAAAASLSCAACADTFEPFAPGAPTYSVFGYLDASADTQWIRARGSRDALLQSTRPIGIAVTLENLATGHTIELRDTALPYVNALGPEAVYAHDFWATERIEPGASYRLRASGRDSLVAETDVRIPRDYQLQVWANKFGQWVWTGGLKQVPFLISNTSYYSKCEVSGFKRFPQAEPPGGDSVSRLVVNPGTGIPEPNACDPIRVTRQLIQVVGSETEWPFGLDWSTWRLAASGLPSTVGNSLGFLGGVLTRWIPMERCQPAYAIASEPYCKLRYDSTTATLRGKIGSNACPVPADSIQIELRELAARPPEAPRIRTANHTDQVGSYEIGALQTGIPHELIISVGDTTGRYRPSPYRVYRDTLQFSAGQVSTHFANLVLMGACPAW